MFLQILAYIGIVVGFVFLTLAIASGLYYVSELVEEHSVATKKFLRRSIYAIICIYILLLIFDGFPILLTLFSIATYVIYLQNLKKFPYIDLKSPIFIASCILVVVNHYLWFNHFSEARYGSKIITFAEVSSFFGICIWFIPFALFVSLSASDHVLPTMNNQYGSGSAAGNYQDNNGKKKNQGLAKVVVGNVREFFYQVSRTFGVELDPNHGRII
ncbi:hypothetical protein WICPIJ_006771 [Wickerhamomyces pijperi]|uniref:Protein SVP26 n=1 Tax=Wickerhamomyces pijperi TaxID=599730 RepID=A0A9P8TKK4_WICPI|nr:hypothetical protein WICPIJ_006771 [Wickerhamomyces pijperi]